MIHIELFESFESNSYYDKIDPRSYGDGRIMPPYITLTKSEIDSINLWLSESILSPYSYNWTFEKSWSYNNHADYDGTGPIIINSNYVIFMDGNKKIKVRVHKTEDDWFGVIFNKYDSITMSSGDWFVCDQLSGIKKLIDDINNGSDILTIGF